VENQTESESTEIGVHSEAFALSFNIMLRNVLHMCLESNLPTLWHGTIFQKAVLCGPKISSESV